MTVPGIGRRQRGVALLLTLWALAMLSLLMLEIITMVRLENRQALHQLQQARADLSAEAGLALAVMHLSDPRRDQRWRADGQPHAMPIENGQLTLRVYSDMGKVDLNSSSPELFARLARILGASGGEAGQLAMTLRARQADAEITPLRVLEEAMQLPGMSSDLFERLLPYITVWSGYDEPVAALASAPVRQALGQSLGAPGDAVDPGPVLSVTCETQLNNGARATLNATFLLTLDGGTQAYRLLRWQP